MGRVDELIAYGREHGCSDIHLTYGVEPVVRCNGRLVNISGYGSMEDAVLEEMALEILKKENVKLSGDRKLMDMDLCYETADGARNRVHIYHQKRHTAIAIRLLYAEVPTLEELQLPPEMKALTELSEGLVVVTGAPGSGKTTTLAACVEEINRRERRHIITVEEPVEYLYKNKNCIIEQREVGVDTPGFAEAVRSALREDAEVLLVGELRDKETVAAALHAAETGHLVFAGFHVPGAAEAAEAMTTLFPAQEQQQARVQLARHLKAVASQKLVVTEDGSGRKAEVEWSFMDEAAE